MSTSRKPPDRGVMRSPSVGATVPSASTVVKVSTAVLDASRAPGWRAWRLSRLTQAGVRPSVRSASNGHPRARWSPSRRIRPWCPGSGVWMRPIRPSGVRGFAVGFDLDAESVARLVALISERFAQSGARRLGGGQAVCGGCLGLRDGIARTPESRSCCDVALRFLGGCAGESGAGRRQDIGGLECRHGR